MGYSYPTEPVEGLPGRLNDNDISQIAQPDLVYIPKRSRVVSRLANPKTESDNAMKTVIKQAIRKKLDYIATLDISKITASKHSESNDNYLGVKLKEIAKHLDIVSSQDKNVLVDEILATIDRIKGKK